MWYMLDNKAIIEIKPKVKICTDGQKNAYLSQLNSFDLP